MSELWYRGAFKLRKSKGLYQKRSSFASQTDFFLSRVDRSNVHGCWLWTGKKSTYGGYGILRSEGRQVRAHRVAYELFVGPIPDHLEVRHTCDVRLCVNPQHLLLGTHRENMEDMVLRHRAATIANGRHSWVTNRDALLAGARNRKPNPCAYHPRGESHANHKLTVEQVQEIRRQRGHIYARDLANQFGVSRATVSAIWQGRLWKWLPSQTS